jgi:hypothetical protein
LKPAKTSGRNFDERQPPTRQQIEAEFAVTKAKPAEEDAAFEAMINDEPPQGAALSSRVALPNGRSLMLVV